MDRLLQTGLRVHFSGEGWIRSSDSIISSPRIFWVSKDDSETTTLVRGMHGLFEPVFPLTTNKSPCQSAGVYLARLSAIPHVFSSDSWHMSQSKPPARQKNPDTFYFSNLSWPFCIMLRVFLIHSQTLPRYTHSFNEFRHTSFLWPHMHSEQARSQITSLTKLERKEFTFNQ